MCKRLIFSINANRQASTILMANGDFIADHCLEIEQATATGAKKAFLPVRERDLFQLDPQNTVMLELDPSFQGLLFPELSLEDPDLESIMGDEVFPEMKVKILTAVKQSQTNNQQMVQHLDAKAKSLYSSATGLVNDGVETLRGYGKVQTALDVCLQSVVRSGPFVKEPCSSLAGVKLFKDKGTTCAMSSANNIAKKKRSKGSGRKTQGLPPRNPLPPVQHQAASYSGPAAQGCSGLQKSKSGSGKHPKSSFWKMHRMNPSSTSASMDREVQTAERQQQTSQVKSKGYKSCDQGGVGRSGSSQSSSHHGRTHRGQVSSTNAGPPRPAPVDANPDAQAAYAPDQASGGSAGQSGQHFRQPDEQSGVTAKKVRYSIC